MGQAPPSSVNLRLKSTDKSLTDIMATFFKIRSPDRFLAVNRSTACQVYLITTGTLFAVTLDPSGISPLRYLLAVRIFFRYNAQGRLYSNTRRVFRANARCDKALRLLQNTNAERAFFYKMPFPSYGAFHSVRDCLQRAAAPKGQTICDSCCWHLWQGTNLGL